jgi:prepilin-type N-terminal cleavage/methylation domain-containing protein
MKTRSSNTAGFTLVELAIVIMIISLVLGGVVLGRSLIRNSELTAVVGEYQTFMHAIGQFHDKYRGLPGDFYSAEVAEASGGEEVGNGNGRIIEAGEEFFAWVQLVNVKLLEGNFTGASG